LSLLATTGSTIGALSLGAASSYGSVFYFHYESELYRNENGSITVLEEADPSPTMGTVPQLVKVAAAIRNASTIFGSVWIGTVAWISQSLAEPTWIHGPVIFLVWLSSEDPAPTFSGIGVGAAVLDRKNHTAGDYVYAYSYARGNVLTSAPKRYELQVELDREIAADQRLVFAVGVGSTTPSWQMRIYFDSIQYPSQVQLPSRILVVAELAQNRAGIVIVVLILLSLSFIQRRRILGTSH